jgi:hypothetical protein
MRIRHGQEPEEAVYLLFVGEKRRSTHPLPNPALHPEDKHLPQLTVSILVARLRDRVQMKLNSFLITPAIEADLPSVLKKRLAQARKRYAEDSEY